MRLRLRFLPAMAAGLTAGSLMASKASAAILYTDDYSNPATVTSNYTASSDGGTTTWTAVSGRVDGTVSNSGFATSVLLANTSVADTSGLTKYTVSGRIGGPGIVANQSGLVIAGAVGKRSYFVHSAGGGAWALSRGNSTVLGGQAGMLTTGATVSASKVYDVTAEVDVTGINPVIKFSVFNVTDNVVSLAQTTVTDTTITSSSWASTVGTQVGWWNRSNSGGTTNFDNLSLVPEPASAGVFTMAAAGLLGRRRRRGNAK